MYFNKQKFKIEAFFYSNLYLWTEIVLLLTFNSFKGSQKFET